MRRRSLLALLLAFYVISAMAGTDPGRLTTRNPDGWFTLSIPAALAKVHRHADVDGGFFDGDDTGARIFVSWTYWTYEATPNAQRDGNGNYPRNAPSMCKEKSQSKHIVVDGHPAIVEQCKLSASIPAYRQQNYRYRYAVGFSELSVAQDVDTTSEPPATGAKRGSGVFTIYVDYRNQGDEALAKRIATSLRFVP
ncbi:hypothetical protein EC912_102320 [Luteibacter rhizovicinus]|uniref:Uncharacterized protein n=1 Tax=Luteibacter rhizovicinus TaxID=242606 RepID=A0A4R3YU57_9GAMM|nr:hypothetical protein [Luteibacter rhizovicinus]TCV95972.1 hypothetical protein EC912_102320 [Luteibacter rhizovicinus]